MEPDSRNPDQLKALSSVFQADPRNIYTVRSDDTGLRRATLADHHADASRFVLVDTVPDAVRTYFETTRNLYLYAWMVYRFYPVAEHHALSCLELALRTRFSDKLPRKYWRQTKRKPTLRPLLQFAVDSSVIRNDGFRRWHDAVRRRAEERYRNERYREMEERNLSEIELDYADAVPNEEDRNFDYLDVLLEVLPGIRNAYAHGSTMLHNQVLGTLELVCEIINQLFSPGSEDR